MKSKRPRIPKYVKVYPMTPEDCFKPTDLDELGDYAKKVGVRGDFEWENDNHEKVNFVPDENGKITVHEPPKEESDQS